MTDAQAKQTGLDQALKMTPGYQRYLHEAQEFPLLRMTPAQIHDLLEILSLSWASAPWEEVFIPLIRTPQREFRFEGKIPSGVAEYSMAIQFSEDEVSP